MLSLFRLSFFFFFLVYFPSVASYAFLSLQMRWSFKLCLFSPQMFLLLQFLAIRYFLLFFFSSPFYHLRFFHFLFVPFFFLLLPLSLLPANEVLFHVLFIFTANVSPSVSYRLFFFIVLFPSRSSSKWNSW